MNNLTKSQCSFNQFLESIISDPESRLEGHVAKEILSEEFPLSTMEDLLRYWCESWIIGSLIYYSDTHKFFDDFYNDIEDIRMEYWQELGVNLNIKEDYKNYMAWFVFEYSAYIIYTKWEDFK